MYALSAPLRIHGRNISSADDLSVRKFYELQIHATLDKNYFIQRVKRGTLNRETPCPKPIDRRDISSKRGGWYAKRATFRDNTRIKRVQIPWKMSLVGCTPATCCCCCCSVEKRRGKQEKERCTTREKASRMKQNVSGMFVCACVCVFESKGEQREREGVGGN